MKKGTKKKEATPELKVVGPETQEEPNILDEPVKVGDNLHVVEAAPKTTNINVENLMKPRRVTPQPERPRRTRKVKEAVGQRISQASVKIAGLLLQALGSEWDAAALPENETMTVMSVGKGGRMLKIGISYTVMTKDENQMKLF